MLHRRIKNKPPAERAMADDFYEKNLGWKAQRDQLRQSKALTAADKEVERKQQAAVTLLCALLTSAFSRLYLQARHNKARKVSRQITP
jgi:hypothetical protein